MLAHHLADPEKGSGIAMICTFGDTTDVVWWRELGLPVRSIVGRDGRIVASPPPDVPDNDARGVRGWSSVSRRQAQDRRAVADSGDLVGEPRPITHAVKFFEKGDRPSRSSPAGSGIASRRDTAPALLARGRQLEWYPAFSGSATRLGSKASTATG